MVKNDAKIIVLSHLLRFNLIPLKHPVITFRYKLPEHKLSTELLPNLAVSHGRQLELSKCNFRSDLSTIDSDRS